MKLWINYSFLKKKILIFRHVFLNGVLDQFKKSDLLFNNFQCNLEWSAWDWITAIEMVDCIVSFVEAHPISERLSLKVLFTVMDNFCALFN